MKIPFIPVVVGKEVEYILQAHNNKHLPGDGLITKFSTLGFKKQDVTKRY